MKALPARESGVLRPGALKEEPSPLQQKKTPNWIKVYKKNKTLTLWTTYRMKCSRFLRSSRRFPAGMNSSFVLLSLADKSTFLSSLRRFLPPTRGVQRPEPSYRPSWFLFVKHRYLLRAFGLYLLHVSSWLSWAAAGCERGGFIPELSVASAEQSNVWAGLGGLSQKFPDHATREEIAESWCKSSVVICNI